MGSSQLPGCRKESWLTEKGWTLKSDNPALSQGTQDLEARNIRVLQACGTGILLEMRPPGCHVSWDAWTGLSADRELLPRYQTGQAYTSAVSQNLAERNQIPTHS